MSVCLLTSFLCTHLHDPSADLLISLVFEKYWPPVSLHSSASCVSRTKPQFCLKILNLCLQLFFLLLLVKFLERKYLLDKFSFGTHSILNITLMVYIFWFVKLILWKCMFLVMFYMLFFLAAQWECILSLWWTTEEMFTIYFYKHSVSLASKLVNWIQSWFTFYTAPHSACANNGSSCLNWFH